jgi:serine protease AprX
MRENLKNPMKPISLFRKGNSPSPAFSSLLRCLLVLPVVLTWTLSGLKAQQAFEETAPSYYRIEFTNKNNNPFTIDNPGEFLSVKALERRNRQGISVKENDLPVTPAYLDSLVATGANILNVSKWFNAATVHVSHDSILNAIARLTFVKKTQQKKVPNPTLFPGNQSGIKQETAPPELDYGPSWWQTAIHQGQILHNAGYRGKGMTIAVIDAGFYAVDELPAFDNLWNNSRILVTRDFVEPGSDLFLGHSHGMVVLSIIGGYLPGELIGTAPEASFILLRSEDADSEFIIEEDNWITAVEYADSSGADIINTSLGYTLFDDPRQDHIYADMDGNTTRISRAADMAASKGMLVVISAGNEGNSAWRHIGAPADADSVLAIGAIDATSYVAGFSSRGPSADGDVKPDVMAIGKGTYMAGIGGGIVQGNGTSLSAPVITGLAACLWQTSPGSSAMEVLASIRESADRYQQPGEDYGYGIPDFNLASVLLKVGQDDQTYTEPITAFPNPFSDYLYVIFQTPVDGALEISLIDLAGKEIMRSTVPPLPGRDYLKLEGAFSRVPSGAYLLKIHSGTLHGFAKLIRY